MPTAQSSFHALREALGHRMEPVTAGLNRTAPNLRPLVERQIERFRGNDPAPAPIADEGIALALFGYPGQIQIGNAYRDQQIDKLFLDYHQACGGLARALEVVLAASLYEHRHFQWDHAEWAIRRAPAQAALESLGVELWADLRRRASKTLGEELKAAHRVLEGATSRALLLRGALAYAFPKYEGLWRPEDDVAIRHFEVGFHGGSPLAILPCLRDTSLELMPEAPAVRKALKEKSIAPLRLMGAWEELEKLGTPDALKVLAEFADWEVLPDLEPKRALTLAPLLSTERPRRVNGLRFVRGVLHRACLRDPKLAKQSKDPVVAECLRESGALLPAAPWTSPWAAVAKKPQEKPKPPATAKELPYREAMHWTKDEREAGAVDEDTTAASSKQVRKEVESEAKRDTAFLFQLSRMTDADALAVWNAIASERWYGDVSDLLHPLVRFGVKALEPALKMVTGKPLLLPALASVDSPRVARFMARGFVKVKKVKDVGETWLRRFPRAAAQGLLPELIHSEKERRDVAAFAIELLRAHAPDVVDAVATELGPDWKAFCSASVKQAKKLPKKPSLPSFIDRPTLPRPIIDGTALEGDALGELICLIKLGLTPDQKFEPASLTRLAWELFARWLTAGAPPKEKWCMQSLGLFPADENAEALGPIAKHWAPNGSPTRSQDAVEVLAAMRTPAGLAQLMMLSKVQSKALRAKAAAVFEKEAAKLELTPEDLADRLVPDFGPLELSTDAGDFEVRFDVKLRPSLVDSSGAPATLPKKADEATREWWETFEKSAPPLGRAQARRLERAMVEGKEMSLQHFTETYALHPVLSHLARGVLWGEYEKGKLMRALAFQDGALIDVNGKKVLPEHAMGVVHPADLDDATLRAWRARLVEQPFAQLERPVRRVSQDEVKKHAARLEGREIDTERLVRLARAGWRQGEAFQGGCYNTLERGGVVISFTPGIWLGDWKLNARQQLEVSVAAPEPRSSLRSEVMNDLTALSA